MLSGVLDMYCVWSWQRNRIIPATTIGVDLENVSTVTVDGLLYSLPRFTCKTYDSGGSEYTPKTLKDILLIQMYLRSLGIVQKFLSFPHLLMSLDNKMKLNEPKGLGREVKTAEALGSQSWQRK